MYSLVSSMAMSFFSWSPSGSKFIGLEAYRIIFSDPIFWRSLTNTLYLMAISVPCTILLSLVVAFLLDSMKIRQIRDFFHIVVLLPMMTSLVAAALIWQWIFDPSFGVMNYLIGIVGLPRQGWLTSPEQVIPSLSLINVWLRVGFNTTILLAGLQAIPTEYYDAALIDGASGFKAFIRITLPLLNPQIVLVTITEMIFTFKAFEQVYITTGGGPANASRVIILYLYETAFKWFRFGDASVVAVFLFVALLLVSVFQWVFVRREVEY
jgi:multiple sugar transport system permease protein